jgi:carbonic anhydrase/acetyltransferase-like protein (isoleucine patch superfamily)
MPIYRFEQHSPVIDDTAYIHPSAEIIGDVIIEAHCYIAPGAVLRGDFGRIHVQHHSNIQDHCVLHSFPDKHCIVHPYGHVGHASVLHGCTLKDNVLIGMNAVVMDETIIAENSIVAANSFVPAKFTCSPASLIMGMPAKVKRQLTDDEISWKSQGTDEYVQLAGRYLDSLQEVRREDLASTVSERKESAGAYQYKPDNS